MKRFLLPLLAALALPSAVNTDKVVAREEYLASSPAPPPFTDPPSVRIPEGFPFNTVSPQLFKRAYWLQNGIDNDEYFRIAFYEGKSRRSGNIVSILTMDRSINKNQFPNYHFTILRYDCVNDRYQREAIARARTALVDWADEYPNGQLKVFIEGYPNWATRSDYLSDWIQVRMGSYGAGDLDYACSNY